MTRHYTDLGSASDWSCCVGNLIQPIRNTTQIWVVTRHQYGISGLVSQSSFGGKTSGSIAKCRLFSQATAYIKPWAYTSSSCVLGGFINGGGGGRAYNRIRESSWKQAISMFIKIPFAFQFLIKAQNVKIRVQRNSFLQLAIRASWS